MFGVFTPLIQFVTVGFDTPSIRAISACNVALYSFSYFHWFHLLSLLS